MLKALSEFFDRALRSEAPQTPVERDHAIRVATALLLVEVARADYQDDVIEDRAMQTLIKEHFQLDDTEAELLLDEARQQADRAVSLQSFTRELHEHLSFDEKSKVVEMLWKVALADDKLDKYEDYVVRKVADLLYVPHSDLIRIRNRVRESDG
jgi:uncharacterized tellurite resistance protein B-like protein